MNTLTRLYNLYTCIFNLLLCTVFMNICILQQTFTYCVISLYVPRDIFHEWSTSSIVKQWLLHRWWKLSVSALSLQAPLTVHPNVTIQETLTLLNKEGFDQVPVVDDSG